MKISKLMKKLIVLVAVLCMTFSVTATVWGAEASQEVIDAKNGVVQINVVWVADNGTEIKIQGGSGFLVNSDTIITCYHVIDVDSITQETMAEILGDSYSKNYENHIKYKVVIFGDMQVDASYVNGSEATDFAILRLNSPANNKKALPLADSDAVEVTESVYALGFPAAVQQYQSVNLYDSDDVTVTDGTVSKKMTEDKVDMIQHSAELTYGNSGGPLLDTAGNVLGICMGFLDSETGTNYYYAVSINQVKTALDSLGIEYTNASNIIDDTTTEEVVVTTEAATVPVDATEAPTTVNKSGSGINLALILGIVAALIVIAIVVVIIIVLTTSGKKRSAPATPVAPQPSRPVPPVPPMSNPGMVAPTPMPMATDMNQGAGETTVLNEGAGETTVLSAQPTAYLLRIKNGEKIVINRPEFTIGKERRRVDYCISDNNSVSRCHSKLITRAGQHFIIDMNSTNFTYVNGTKLAPNQESALNNGDKIKVSDEEFEFRTI